MAKVEMPLASLEASGKYANRLVFFKVRGRNVVRNFVKPTQKNSDTQGYVRVALNIFGKWTSKVSTVMKGAGVDSQVYQYAYAKKPENMNWNAWLVGKFCDRFISAGTFATALFESFIGDFSSLGTDLRTAYNTNASALNIADFAFSYGYTSNIPAGVVVYAGALGCYANSIATIAPYTIDPNSWAASDVNSFKTDMVTA